MTKKIIQDRAEVTAWLERVRYLSEEIGPRGPTGQGSEKAPNMPVRNSPNSG